MVVNEYMSSSPSPKTKTKRRILVMDDESDITFTLKKGLENSGMFEVDTFNDPQEALSSFKPDYRSGDIYPFSTIWSRLSKTIKPCVGMWSTK